LLLDSLKRKDEAAAANASQNELKCGLLDKFREKLSRSAAYLTKPFDPEDLIRTVRKHIAE
jgi:CheY-like chemotaxis protein